MVLSQLIVFNYKVNCYVIKLRFGTGRTNGRTDRGGYRSPSAGTSGLKISFGLQKIIMLGENKPIVSKVDLLPKFKENISTDFQK